jgi:hypothetical protein
MVSLDLSIDMVRNRLAWHRPNAAGLPEDQETRTGVSRNFSSGISHISAQLAVKGCGTSYVAEGHPGLALPIFREVEPLFPQIQLYEAVALARMGQQEGSLR